MENVPDDLLPTVQMEGAIVLNWLFTTFVNKVHVVSRWLVLAIDAWQQLLQLLSFIITTFLYAQFIYSMYRGTSVRQTLTLFMVYHMLVFNWLQVTHKLQFV